MIIIDPDETLDYAFDFAPRLDTGETISNPRVIVPDDITLTPQGTTAPAVSGSKVVCWLKGGTIDQTYDVVCRVDTSAGRTLDLTMHLWAQQR